MGKVWLLQLPCECGVLRALGRGRTSAGASWRRVMVVVTVFMVTVLCVVPPAKVTGHPLSAMIPTLTLLFCCFWEERLQVREWFTPVLKGICLPRLSPHRLGLRAPFTRVWCPHRVIPWSFRADGWLASPSGIPSS